ncbi:ATP-binding protein [Deinococcus sp. UR1]|uniref:ATP-binding protein n=1 Tax=Deinococcus sp. UR1 TaxID=1704277 RepID=UPI000C190CEB|nr:ATP-binding protein [Deinococcus sp. UR1]PIG95648.1 hypothetical protein AMD26_020025 [Deinococcus sp. UR1]
MTRRPTASKNLGDDYRDAIGLSYVVQMLKDPGSVLWVSFENKEAGSLDDVMVGLSDRVRYIQAKYTVDESVWSLKDLLEKKKGQRATSLLQKWVLGWKKVKALGSAYEAVIKTRRRPDPGLAELITDGHFTDRLWTDPANASAWRGVCDHLAAEGVTQDETRLALDELLFEFGELDVEHVFAETEREFLDLGGTQAGWNSLVEQFRRWVRYESSTSDGRIRVGDARVAARLWQPDTHAIPQEFQRDLHFVPFNYARQRLVTALGQQPSFVLLEGPPGSGKSSLLSWLAQEPPEGTIQVLLHHCFIGPEDNFRTRRLSVEASVEGLLEQIYRTAREALTRPENPDQNRLAEWLRDLARDAHAQDKYVLLILDGVDHMVREHQLADARRLLSLLPSPLPDGLKVVVGTQPIQDLLPPSIDHIGAQRISMAMFNEDTVRAYLEGYAGVTTSDEVVRAAHTRSEGNPLYLRYLVESSADVQYDLTVDRIEASPPFGGDIARYYAALWHRLHTGPASDHAAHAAAQLLVSLLGWADFSLPETDLDHFSTSTSTPLHVLVGAVRGVRHLLAPGPLAEGRLLLYHDSLRRFVREQGDAAALKGPALRGLLRWLTDRADAETRWSAEWEIRLHLGEPEPLLEGTTRSWVVESFTRHRPRHRTLELLRLAASVAADRHDLRGLLRVGWLNSYVSNAIDIGGEHIFIADLNGRLNLGMNQADAIRAVQTNIYPLPGLARLIRTAAHLGYEALIDVIVGEALDFEDPDPDALCTVLAHHRNVEWQNIVEWYHDNLLTASPTTPPMGHSQTYWRRAFRACAQELAVFGRTEALEDLHAASELDPHDRLMVQDALLRCLIRDAQRPAVIAQLTTHPPASSYAHAVAYALGSTVPIPVPPLLSVMPAEGANYLDDGGWCERHADLIWKSFSWAAAGRQADLAVERHRLERQGIHGQVLAVLLDVGSDLHVTIQARRPLDFAVLSRRLAVLSGWTDARDDHFYASRAALDGWLHILTLVLELIRAVGIPAELSDDDLHAAYEAVGTNRMMRWLEFEGLDFTTVEAVEPLLDELEAFHTGAIEDFQERAATLANLANAAAAFGASGHAERLLRASAENLLAHGNRKDIVLFNVLKSLDEAHHPDGEVALLRLAPFIDVITELTDGSETRHLPMRLFEALLEVSPGRAYAYLNAWIDRDDDWRSELGAAYLFKSLKPGDPVAFRLAVTLTQEDGFNAARQHLKAHAECVGTAQAWDDYERWLAVECPPSYRTERSYEREWGPDRKIYGPILPVDTIKAMLRSAERRVMNQDGEVALALRWWRAHPGSLARGDLGELGRLMLARDVVWAHAGPYDDLWALAWEARERELAFRAVVAAQTAANGWASNFTSRQESDRRVKFVVRHFRTRFEEFAVTSCLRHVQSYGATQVPPRLIAGLWEAGKHDLAQAVARDFLDFAETLKADVNMPVPAWVIAPELPDLIDVMLHRLSHVQPYVRVRTAVAISDLYPERPEVLNRILLFVGRRPSVRWEAALLALSLISQQNPEEVAALLPSAGRHAAAGGPGIALLFNEVCRICGREDLVIATASQVPPMETAPIWFNRLVEETPFLASSLRMLNGRQSAEHVYGAARVAGLTASLAQDAKRAEQLHLTRTQWSRTPICTAAFDLTASALLDVAAQDDSMAVDDQRALLASLLHVDGSLGRLRPEGLPGWLPAFPDTGKQSVVAWPAVAEAAFIARLSRALPHGRIPLVLQAQMVQGDGRVAARFEARAFAYSTLGVLPDAEDVWRVLEENRVLNPRYGAHVLDDQREWRFQWSSGQIEGIIVRPLTAELRLVGAAWHFLPQLTRVSVPLIGHGSLRELVPRPQEPLTYDAPGISGAVRGSFWQDGAPTQLFMNRAAMANVGYELDIDRHLLERLVEEGMWSLGWVVQISHSARQDYSSEPKLAERVFLHGVSPIIHTP